MNGNNRLQMVLVFPDRRAVAPPLVIDLPFYQAQKNVHASHETGSLHMSESLLTGWACEDECQVECELKEGCHLLDTKLFSQEQPHLIATP